MNHETNDWKLTAFALGELDADEQAEIEANVHRSPELQREVEQIRATAGLLTRELQASAPAGLTDAQRENIVAAGASSQWPASSANAAHDGRNRQATGRRTLRLAGWFWIPSTIAASVAIIAVGWAALGFMADTGPFGDRVRRLTSASSIKGIGTSAKLYSDQSVTVWPVPPSSPELTGATVDPSTGWYVSPPTGHYALPHTFTPSTGTVATGERVELTVDNKTGEIRFSGPRALGEAIGGPLDQGKFFDRANAIAGAGGLDSSGVVSFVPLDEEFSNSLLIGTSREAYLRTLELIGESRALASLGYPTSARDALSAERYNPIVENPFMLVESQPLSTFSIDVDTAAYANVRRFLTAGRMPPADAVRIEEMVNYFDYNYPPPGDEHPFSVNLEISECPWAPEHRLARIGIKGYELDPRERPAANLVFLIDVSGSMNTYDKLPLVQEALSLLIDQLDRRDSIGIVVYAGASGIVLNPTNGADKNAIRDAVDRLQAGGSTNGGAGIQDAYQLASQSYIEGGINRVILATDGDFNVGVTHQGELQRLIEEKTKTGVFLSVLGFGMGNLQDATLETLADKGNGNYAYIDTIEEAQKVLVDEMDGTLFTIAKDVKIQVEFNPLQVAAYRLVGYENRMLAAQDFNDDKKDAGEIGAGHTVTAFYEIVPAGQPVDAPMVDELKYQTLTDVTPAAESGEMMTVKLRYKEPDGETSKLIEAPVSDAGATFAESSDDFAFAAAVASFGMLLRGSPHAAGLDYPAVLEMAESALGDDPSGYRAEFIGLVHRAVQLQPAAVGTTTLP